MPIQNPLDAPLKKLAKAVTRAKPAIMAKAGALGISFVLENFQKQGFQGATFQPWKPRKSKSKKNQGRNILTLSGHLRNATRIVSSSDEQVIFGNSTPYAAIHNQGGTIHHAGGVQTVHLRKKRNGQFRFTKAKGRYKVAITRTTDFGFHYWDINMPQRRFIGDSPILNTRVEIMMVKELLKQFK